MWNNTTALSVAASLRGGELAAQTSILHTGRFLELGGGLMWSSHNRYGLFLQSRWRPLSTVEFTGEYRYLSERHTTRPSTLFEEGFRNGLIAVNSDLFGVHFEAGRRWQHTLDDRQITDFVRMQWPLRHSALFDARLSLDASRSGRDYQLLAGITFSRRLPGAEVTFGQTGQHRRRADVQESALTGQLRGRFDTVTLPDGSSLNNQLFVARSEQLQSVGIESRLAGQRWGGHVALDQSWPHRGAAVSSYAGHFATTLLASEAGVVVGSDRPGDSAVVVELKGHGDKQYAIFVNDRLKTQARAGSQVPITLAPFRQYEVTVRPVADNFADVEQTRKTVTLYPGNVVHLSFRVQGAELMIGRLQSPAGSPVVDALLLDGRDLPLSDGQGLFQARVPAGLNILNVLLADGRLCEIVLPEQRVKRRGVTKVNLTVCGD